MGRCYAGVELGGTKTVVVLGARGTITERVQLPTTLPDETLGRATEVIMRWQERGEIAALGVASFGPIRVDRAAPDFGTMLETPKPGWSGAPVAATMNGALGLPLALDTDVNAAALAEAAFGAARGCSSMIYLTIGTGLGGGVVIDGRTVRGVLHPELGHVRLRRQAGDSFAGACPFHGDCAEGLLSGPALAARIGRNPAELPATDPVWQTVAQDLAELLTMLVLTLSPQRIVVGGGVANGQPHLLSAAVSRIPALLGGYLVDMTEERLSEIIVPPMLGDDAGPTGALLLAAAVK
jgi:Transcriptional regulator/sugar kinase